MTDEHIDAEADFPTKARLYALEKFVVGLAREIAPNRGTRQELSTTLWNKLLPEDGSDDVKYTALEYLIEQIVYAEDQP